jgi:hypothetical protein
MSIEINNNISNQKMSDQVKKFEILMADFIFFKIVFIIRRIQAEAG